MLIFPPENRAVREITWKNIAEPDWLQITVWRMLIALWMPKATNAFWWYVILIAYPLQKCLQERASMLRYSPLPALFHRVRVYTAKELTRLKAWTAAWNRMYSSANYAQSNALFLKRLHDEGSSFFQNFLYVFTKLHDIIDIKCRKTHK
jgi:hypothetical protein